jgi:hypothetical protein
MTYHNAFLTVSLSLSFYCKFGFLFSGFGMPANNGQGDAAPEQHQPQEHEGVQGGALGYRLQLDEISKG